MQSYYPWQAEIWQQLTEVIKLKRLAHGLIFVGAKGVGKNHFAKVLASKIINKPNQQNLIDAGTHPDVLTIGISESSKVIKVGDLRDFLAKTQLTPMLAKQKVAIIDNTELMTLSAANNFLKTLEEPAGKTTFVLISHMQQALLPTIKSRCQTFIFKEPETKQAVDWLQADTKLAQTALLMANNSPILAEKFLDQAKQQQFIDTLAEIYQLNINNLFATANKWSLADLPVLSWWQTLVSQLLAKSMATSTEFSPAFNQFTKQLTDRSLIKFYDKLLTAKKLLASSINRKLVFEDLLISWCELWQKN